MFAFAMSVVNSQGLLSSGTGYLVNEYLVGVSKTDLSQFYKLQYIQIASALFELIYIRLIPIKSDIKDLIEKINKGEVEESEENDKVEM